MEDLSPELIALSQKVKVECNYFFRWEWPETLRYNICDCGVCTIKNVVLRASYKLSLCSVSRNENRMEVNREG